MSNLQFAELCVKRDSLTRNLPEGKENLRWVSNTAILIYGGKDAVLVDTFITIEHNQKLIDWIKSFNRNLKYIYITHGHGDHFFGIKQVKEAFPNVKAIATEGTVKESLKQGSLIESFWDKLFPNQIPYPQVFLMLSIQILLSLKDIGWKSLKLGLRIRQIQHHYGFQILNY
ncbi:MBL fold metallo-hydrolase [Paenibacillus anseongensis]|uniref:MBL fold metallo-hydrolase n=1 Tax=Paenibacillus TaxID=44249 RepID=UPI001C671FB1|nr:MULTISPECIES: MBL fold metallo-hydrolase [Paenibacillus]